MQGARVAQDPTDSEAALMLKKVISSSVFLTICLLLSDCYQTDSPSTPSASPQVQRAPDAQDGASIDGGIGGKGGRSGTGPNAGRGGAGGTGVGGGVGGQGGAGGNNN